ncbi:MAG TPA: DUF11 domain-containing protein [Deltaproteobacteria bacterium]|nr:DUF11 domain-containing protein [Deltaproteobacteria bacterium]
MQTRMYVMIIAAMIFAAGTACADSDLEIHTYANPLMPIVGSDLTYTLLARNNGPDEAIGVTVTDVLPLDASLISVSTTQGITIDAGDLVWEIGNLGLAWVSINFIMTPLTAGQFTNTATISSTSFDPVLTNNAATISVTAVDEDQAADLDVILLDYPETVSEGSKATYTILLTNNGPATALNLEFTFDASPLTLGSFQSAESTSGFCYTLINTCVGFGCLYILSEPLEVYCSIDSLPAGETATITVNLGASLSAGEILGVSSSISSGTTADPDISNNIDTHTTLVTEYQIDPSDDDSGSSCFIATAGWGKGTCSR